MTMIHACVLNRSKEESFSSDMTMLVMGLPRGVGEEKKILEIRLGIRSMCVIRGRQWDAKGHVASFVLWN